MIDVDIDNSPIFNNEPSDYAKALSASFNEAIKNKVPKEDFTERYQREMLSIEKQKLQVLKQIADSLRKMR